MARKSVKLDSVLGPVVSFNVDGVKRRCFVKCDTSEQALALRMRLRELMPAVQRVRINHSGRLHPANSTLTATEALCLINTTKKKEVENA